MSSQYIKPRRTTKLMREVQRATIQAYNEGTLQAQRAILDYSKDHPGVKQKGTAINRMSCAYVGLTWEGTECNCVVGAWLKRTNLNDQILRKMMGSISQFIWSGDDTRGYQRLRVGSGGNCWGMNRNARWGRRIYKADHDFLIGVQAAHDRVVIRGSTVSSSYKEQSQLLWGEFVAALGLTLIDLPFPTINNDPLQRAKKAGVIYA